MKSIHSSSSVSDYKKWDAHAMIIACHARHLVKLEMLLEISLMRLHPLCFKIVFPLIF